MQQRLHTRSSVLRHTSSKRLTHFPRSSAPAQVVTQAPPTIDTAARYNVVSIAQQTKEIRDRLCSSHVAGGLLYVEAGDLVLRNGGDVYYRFRPQSDFAYLTQCDIPGSAALIDSESGRFTLLVPKLPEDMAFWVGPQPSLDDLAATYGADSVAYTTDLAAVLRAAGKGRDVHVPSSQPTAAERVVAALRGQIPSSSAREGSPGHNGFSSADGGEEAGQWVVEGGGRVMDSLLQPVLHKARAVKTDAEVGCLMEASRVSGAAHMDTWRACKPGLHEYSLEAAFTSSCMSAGLSHLGYPCIVGAGRNAAVLHYDTNRARVGEDDLVLIDAGAEFRYYTADITRTFPAGGRFRSAQRDVADAVLDAQMAALALVKPGAMFSDADTAARRVLLARLQDMGCVSSEASIDALMAAKIDRVFMPHGLGHFLGLDVHDVSGEGPVPRSTPLTPGHVLTVEPGLYFIDTLLARAAKDSTQAPLISWDTVESLKWVGGVRTEDNVVITQDGHFNMTMAAGVVKESLEIERVMQGEEGGCLDSMCEMDWGTDSS